MVCQGRGRGSPRRELAMFCQTVPWGMAATSANGEQTEGATAQVEIHLPGSRGVRGLDARPAAPTSLLRLKHCNTRHLPPLPFPWPSSEAGVFPQSTLHAVAASVFYNSWLHHHRCRAPKPPTAPQCSQEAAQAPSPDMQSPSGFSPNVFNLTATPVPPDPVPWQLCPCPPCLACLCPSSSPTLLQDPALILSSKKPP